ncbi:STAS domain-containing protein [Nocardia terpenica]|uniref:STAS domain-containing protein n=1 Tax=Nocardia terpenica TaxID=455432 RepID=A0A6G9Z2X2_9NOCA|nr:STAS domain-containing protein [Nocardia terpenica]QIS19536.1 STAS domain-containing protein [Nocardia terpenica]
MSTISVIPGRLTDEVPATGHRLRRTVGGHYTRSVDAPDCLVVRVDGELDITNLETFRRALSYAIEGSAPTVVVDLRRTRFLSLRNAFALVEAMDEARRVGVGTHLLAGRREIERVLEVTGARTRAHLTSASRQPWNRGSAVAQ